MQFMLNRSNSSSRGWQGSRYVFQAHGSHRSHRIPMSLERHCARVMSTTFDHSWSTMEQNREPLVARGPSPSELSSIFLSSLSFPFKPRSPHCNKQGLLILRRTGTQHRSVRRQRPYTACTHGVESGSVVRPPLDRLGCSSCR